MADDFGVANWLIGASSTLADTILYIVLAIVIILIGAIIWYVMSFKYKVRVREIVRGRMLVKDDVAKAFKNKKNGTVWWKLLKYKRVVPEPPTDCVDITNKGKKVTEYFRTGDDQFIPISVKFDYEAFKGQGFKPYDTNQRSMLVQEHREAEDYKKKSLGDKLMAIFPFIAVIMILIVFMLFFGEVVAPTKELAQSNQAMADKLIETWGLMENIVLEREQLQNDDIVRDNVVETPPN